MRRINCLSIALLGVSLVSAQGVTDVLKYSKNDIVGTARYMGMSGAFGALGGDISTLSQNPAGIGVYRSSEVVATLSLGNVETKTNAPTGSSFSSPNYQLNKFNIDCNNLGYVGTFMTGKRSGLINFNVGFAFNRQGGEKKRYKISQNNFKSSLSDYIADRTNIWATETNGAVPSDLVISSSNDPYYSDLSAPWISILAYNTFVINDVSDNGNNFYEGLYPNLSGGGDLVVEENNRIDEYTFNVGGNFNNSFYWGLGIGISDLNVKYRSFYDEYYWDEGQPDTYQNYGNYRLDNYLNVSGTGINIKAGIIAKLTPFLRFSAAVHTPTWYHMTDRYGAEMESFNVPGNDGFVSEYINTPNDFSDYLMRTPWKFQLGGAYILGSKGLISVEYERINYSFINLKDEDGYEGAFQLNNNDIKNQLRGVNTLKIGGEYRLTPLTSMRLGYAHQSSPYQSSVLDNNNEIFPSGTIPNYTLDRDVNYYTGGLGYRNGSIFADVAFVWRTTNQDAYLMPTVPNYVSSEKSNLKTTSYKFLVTVGYKF